MHKMLFRSTHENQSVLLFNLKKKIEVLVVGQFVLYYF